MCSSKSVLTIQLEAHFSNGVFDWRKLDGMENVTLCVVKKVFYIDE